VTEYAGNKTSKDEVHSFNQLSLISGIKDTVLVVANAEFKVFYH